MSTNLQSNDDNNNETSPLITTVNHNNEKSSKNDENNHNHNPTCFQYTKLLFFPFVLIFLVGCTNAFASGYFADLSDDTFGNNSYAITGGFSGAKGLLRFGYTPVFSSMSDSVGRRPVIIGALIATATPSLVYTISGNFWAFQVMDTIFDLIMLLISSLFSSLVSDVIRSDRARVVGQALILSVYESALGFSFLGDMLDVRLAMMMAAISSLLAAVVAYFTVSETAPRAKILAQSNTTRIDDAGNNNNDQEEKEAEKDEIEEAQNLQESKSIIFNAKRSIHVFKKYFNIRLLCLVAVFNSTDQALYSGPIMIFAKDQLGFDTTDQSYFLLSVAIVSVLFSFLLAFATKLLKRNKMILIVGLIGNFALSVAWAFIKTKMEVYLFSAILFLCYMALPSISALAAQTVLREEIGAAMGCIATARVVANTIAPAVMGELFAVAKDSDLPGWPFLTGAGCAIIAIVIASFIEVEEEGENEQEGKEETGDEGTS